MGRVRGYTIPLTGLRQSVAAAVGIEPGGKDDVGFDILVFHGAVDLTGICKIGGHNDSSLPFHLDVAATPNQPEDKLQLTGMGGVRLSEFDVHGKSGDVLGILGIMA